MVTGGPATFHDGNLTSDLRVDESTMRNAELYALAAKGYSVDRDGNVVPLPNHDDEIRRRALRR